MLTQASHGGSGHVTPQNTEYFKVKEFEKMAEAERSWWPSPDSTPLKQVTKPSGDRSPPSCRKGAPLPPKRDGHQEESSLRGSAKLPPVYYTYHIPFDLSYFSVAVPASSNLAENTQVRPLVYVLISLRKLLCHLKPILNKCCSCLILIASWNYCYLT